jgi:hypothetical protein
MPYLCGERSGLVPVPGKGDVQIFAIGHRQERPVFFHPDHFEGTQKRDRPAQLSDRDRSAPKNKTTIFVAIERELITHQAE